VKLVRFPAAIQSHGALLVAEAASRVLTHVSENSLELLGIPPVTMLGQPISTVIDAATQARFDEVLDGGTDASNPTITTVGERQFDVIIRRVAESVIIEFEPFIETPPEMILSTRRAMRRLAEASSVTELQNLAAHEFRRITGFDRVMFEHFHPDGDGEIVAEALVPDLEPRLGRRIPASRIVPHSMTLATRKRSRMIVNVTTPAVALIADSDQVDDPAVDLSTAELRSVTAHHLAFMREHDMVSSFTLSLVRDNQLVGLFMGGHRTERRLPFDIRDAFELLANQISLQTTAMREIEQLAQRNELREVRAALDAQLGLSGELTDALLHRHVTLLDLIPADGVAVRLGERLDTLGTVPDLAVLRDLAARLSSAGAPASLVTSSLPREHPDLGRELPGVAGLLVQPLSHEGDYLAWFRRERARFDGWVDEFDGTAEPWYGMQRQARELVRDLQATLLRQAESQLAELALQDPLTGLPNRRLLMDRLQQEIARTRRGTQLAVLFIDLDDFKAINDTRGHSAGDDALRQTADALRRAARTDDTVARLGGDEFVVLCTARNEKDAAALGQRLIDSIAATPAQLSASIGVVCAGPGDDPSQVLSAADAALYRAKLAGKGRVSV
jgi:diguanylate cyclase (GGDEF)-like protein